MNGVWGSGGGGITVTEVCELDQKGLGVKGMLDVDAGVIGVGGTCHDNQLAL